MTAERMIDAGDGVLRPLRALVGRPIWYWGWIWRITGWADDVDGLTIERREWLPFERRRYDDRMRAYQLQRCESVCWLGEPEHRYHHARLLFAETGEGMQ